MFAMPSAAAADAHEHVSMLVEGSPPAPSPQCAHSSTVPCIVHPSHERENEPEGIVVMHAPLPPLPLLPLEHATTESAITAKIAMRIITCTPTIRSPGST